MQRNSFLVLVLECVRKITSVLKKFAKKVREKVTIFHKYSIVDLRMYSILVHAP